MRLLPNAYAVIFSTWVALLLCGFLIQINPVFAAAKTETSNKKPFMAKALNAAMPKQKTTPNPQTPLTVTPKIADPLDAATCRRLPDAVLFYLKTLDPNLVLRQDCLAVLSQQRTYLPILPQGHQASIPAKAMTRQFPAKSIGPDWVEFDNGFYLLRLQETANGKLTLPRTSTLPEGVKTGLIPQNFMVPAGFSIPSELRVIVGNLPYETPVASNTAGQATSLITPGTALEKVSETLSKDNIIEDPVLFTASLQQGDFIAWDAVAWQKKWSLTNLGCLSVSAVATPSGEFVYLNCLNSPKIAVVDVKAQQRLNEIELRHVSQELDQHATYPYIVASHRYQPEITIIDTRHHLIRGAITLPFALQSTTMHPRLPLLYGVDVRGQQVVEVDIQQLKVLRTFKVRTTSKPSKVPVVWIDERAGRFGTLWISLEDKGFLTGLDLFTGETAHIIETPKAITHIAQTHRDSEKENTLSPLIISTKEGLETFELNWNNNQPRLEHPQTVENLAPEATWISFSGTAKANEFIGLDATNEKLYAFKWDPATHTLQVEKPIISSLRSQVLVVAAEPSPKHLALIKAKQESLLPKAGEKEMLTTLRTLPRQKNGLQRLMESLKFAPRDQ
jgi:hypothetical protein